MADLDNLISMLAKAKSAEPRLGTKPLRPADAALCRFVLRLSPTQMFIAAAILAWAAGHSLYLEQLDILRDPQTTAATVRAIEDRCISAGLIIGGLVMVAYWSVLEGARTAFLLGRL